MSNKIKIFTPDHFAYLIFVKYRHTIFIKI